MRAPTTPELITAFFAIATLALIIAIPSIVDDTGEADTAYEALTGKPASGSRHERAGAEGSRGNGGAAGQRTGRSGAGSGAETASSGFPGPRITLALFARADTRLLDLATFRDCPECPEMKVLPAGYVQLGAVRGDTDATEGERPVLRVRHRRSFAIGVLEITVGQYKAFLAQSGHRAPACASFAAADAADPVDCVSYRDARAYVQWLSERTFKQYRLPSASEWEYAARGGNGAVWPTGARLDVEPASAVAGASRRRPAGSFEANSFGLHDMAGGVAEIVRDCWTPTLAGVPTDGTATITRACTERTLKDGAWSEPAKARRASARRPIAIDAAQPGVGFRVVREMR